MKSTIIFLCLLTSCHSFSVKQPDKLMMLGSDRDKHGCIGSAGYRWCQHTNQCERPWELATKVGIENTVKAYNKYCSQVPTK